MTSRRISLTFRQSGTGIREEANELYTRAVARHLCNGDGLRNRGGATPYKITSTWGWEKTPPDNAGYSVGVIQVDFGQQNPAWARDFLTQIDSWSRANGGGGFKRGIDFMVGTLTSNAKNKGTDDKTGIEWMKEEERDLIDAWLAEPVNQSVFFSTFENQIISLNLSGAGTKYPGISSILGDSRFNALSQ